MFIKKKNKNSKHALPAPAAVVAASMAAAAASAAAPSSAAAPTTADVAAEETAAPIAAAAPIIVAAAAPVVVVAAVVEEKKDDDTPSWMKEDTTAATNNTTGRSNSSQGTAASSTTPSVTLSKLHLRQLKEEAAMAAAVAEAAEYGVPLEAITLINDDGFGQLRKLRQHNAWAGQKNKARDDRMKKKEEIVHGVSSTLTASDLEAFTEGKRENAKEEKIAAAIELRAHKSAFAAGKKKKSKLNATHNEHGKRGKLFAMTKYSRRVGSKLKASHEDRNKRDNFNKARGVKFRINRGWKA